MKIFIDAIIGYLVGGGIYVLSTVLFFLLYHLGRYVHETIGNPQRRFLKICMLILLGLVAGFFIASIVSVRYEQGCLEKFNRMFCKNESSKQFDNEVWRYIFASITIIFTSQFFYEMKNNSKSLR